MTGPSLLCCLFLLLGGVFGDTDEVTVSVMKGDSLTLHIKPEETQRTDRLWWRFNSEETAIASLDKEINEIIFNDDKRFKDRLQLDVVSGSLNITNSRTTDSGLYKLEISRLSGDPKYKRFRVTVSEVISVSVIVGESVTLQTDVKIQTDDVIEWKFKGDIIADLTGLIHDGFRNSEVNEQTGDLIITNIRGDQSGDYDLKINSKSLQKIFRVNVEQEKSSGLPSWAIAVISLVVVGGVAAAGGVLCYYHRRNLWGGIPFGMHTSSVLKETVTEMQGHPLFLSSGVTDIQSDDVIQWRFGETLIAEMKRKKMNFPKKGDVVERFRDRLKLDDQTGDLTISDISTEHTGHYNLKIITSGGRSQSLIRVVVKGNEPAPVNHHLLNEAEDPV